MYVEALNLRELRCFREAKVSLLHPDLPLEDAAVLGNVNLLLGNNGAGKTTILKALALGTLAPIMELSGYVPYRLIRRGAEPDVGRATIGANLILHDQDVAPEKLDTNPRIRHQTSIYRQGDYEIFQPSKRDRERDKAMFDDDSPAFLVVGYGATRRVEAADRFDATAQMKRRRLRYQRVAGLFEDHVALTPLGAWLPRLRKQNRGRSERSAGS